MWILMFRTCLCLSISLEGWSGAIARVSWLPTGHGAANATSLWRCWTEEGHLNVVTVVEFQGVPRSSKIPDLWMLVLKCMGFGLFGLFELFGLSLFGVSFCCSSSIKRTCMIDWWWISGVVMGNYMCVSGSCGKSHVSTPALEAILFQHAWLPTTWESMTSPNGHEMMSLYALNANNTDWTLMILDQPGLSFQHQISVFILFQLH